MIARGWYRVADRRQLRRGRVDRRLLGGEVTVQSLGKTAARVALDGRVLPSRIVDDLVLVWFPADGKLAPDYEIAPLQSLHRAGWAAPFALTWQVRSTLVEIAENAVDMGHFTSVHVYEEPAQLRHFAVDEQRMNVAFGSARRIVGVRYPVEIELHYQGLGWVESRVRTPLFCAHVLYTPTPIDEATIDLRLELSRQRSANPLVDRVLHAVMPWEVRRDFERDLPIWENKIVHERPVLCAGDGPIMKLRTWARSLSATHRRVESNAISDGSATP